MTELDAAPAADQPLGDPLPAVLAAYYAALDAGRFTDAAAVFAPSGLYAVPHPGDIETGPRAETVGSAELLERFTARGRQPWRHVIRLCVSEGDAALVEGVLITASGTATSTFVASARLTEDGRIDRYLAFSCPGAQVPMPRDVPAAVTPTRAADVVHSYFLDLDAARFGAAASRFSADVVYSHPPYRHTGITDPGRVVFEGRPMLEAAFNRRGSAAFDHEVITSIQRGPHCILEGAVHNLPDGRTGSFISSLSLAGDGTIRRYVSFYCEPGVRQR